MRGPTQHHVWKGRFSDDEGRAVDSRAKTVLSARTGLLYRGMVGDGPYSTLPLNVGPENTPSVDPRTALRDALFKMGS